MPTAAMAGAALWEGQGPPGSELSSSADTEEQPKMRRHAWLPETGGIVSRKNY